MSNTLPSSRNWMQIPRQPVLISQRSKRTSLMSCTVSVPIFTPESCDTGENCYWQKLGEAECLPPASRPEIGEGEVCVAGNDCADSAICLGAEGQDYVCRYFCISNSQAEPGLGGCPDGQLCDVNSFPTGFANVGFCHP